MINVLAEGLAHPEGPAHLDDGSIVFVESYRERVSRWHPETGLMTFSHCGGNPNACCAGNDGVYITQMGAGSGGWEPVRPSYPSIQKITSDGRIETISTQVEGRDLKAPNDLCFGPSGTLYFTDPDAFDPLKPKDGFIFGLNANGTCQLALNVGPTFPNGIVALGDDSIVWVESYTRRVRRRHPDGKIDLIATLPEGHMPDGLKAGSDGRLYIASIMSGGIDVVAMDGQQQDFIETGGWPLNCLFEAQNLIVADDGDPALGPATVARSGRLLRVPVQTSGQTLYKGAIPSRI